MRLCLPALLLVGYGLFIAVTALPGFPIEMAGTGHFPYLADKPIGEDGFYMLLVAWNFALTGQLSANYGVITTGVQPFVTLVYSAIAKFVLLCGGDKDAFARATIIFGTLNAVLFSISVAKLSQMFVAGKEEGEFAFAITMSLSCLSFYVFRTFTYGLETGVYLTLLVFAIAATVVYAAKESIQVKDCILLGSLFGICGLTRLDFGIVAAILLPSLVVFRVFRVRDAAVVGITAFAIVAPWLIWVFGASGSLIPSSGTAQAGIIDAGSLGNRMAAMVLPIAQNIAPWLFTGARGLPTALAIGGLVSLVAFVSYRGAKSPTRVMELRTRGTIFAWVLGLLMLPITYLIFFWAGHFYARYTSPISILAFVFAGVYAALICAKLRREVYYSVIGISMIVNAAFASASLHSGSIGNSHSVSAGYVRDKIPPDKKIGAFQSGVIGYYNSNVVNLDGKINREALLALKADRIEEYLDQEEIAYVVDWRDAILSTFAEALRKGRWTPCPEPIPNGASICVMRVHKYGLANDRFL